MEGDNIKTADEMFKELGYEVSDSGYYGKTYKKGIYTLEYRDKRKTKLGDGFYKYVDDDSGVSITPDEILACAQLIKEMEE